jgi:hypothetical protein
VSASAALLGLPAAAMLTAMDFLGPIQDYLQASAKTMVGGAKPTPANVIGVPHAVAAFATAVTIAVAWFVVARKNREEGDAMGSESLGKRNFMQGLGCQAIGIVIGWIDMRASTRPRWLAAATGWPSRRAGSAMSRWAWVCLNRRWAGMPTWRSANRGGVHRLHVRRRVQAALAGLGHRCPGVRRRLADGVLRCDLGRWQRDSHHEWVAAAGNRSIADAIAMVLGA